MPTSLLDGKPRGAVRRVLLLTVVATLIAACGGGGSESDDNGALVMGTLPLAGTAGWQLAETQGFLENAGLAVTNVELRTPADSVPNLLSGKVNMSTLNPGNLAQAISQNLALKIIGTTYVSNGEHKLWVLKDSPLTTLKQLEGKTIGLVQLENNVHASILEQLAQAGVDTNTVNFTLVPVAEVPAALRAGRIDVGQVTEPLATSMGDSVRPILDDIFGAYGPQPVLGYNIVSSKFATDRPDTVNKLRTAISQGNDIAASDETLLRKAIGQITGVEPAVLQKFPLPGFTNDLKFESTQQQIDLMVKYGFLDEPVNLQDSYDPS